MTTQEARSLFGTDDGIPSGCPPEFRARILENRACDTAGVKRPNGPVEVRTRREPAPVRRPSPAPVVIDEQARRRSRLDVLKIF